MAVVSLLVLVAFIHSGFSSLSLAAADPSSVAEEVNLENDDCTGFHLFVKGRHLTLTHGACTMGGKTITVDDATELTIPPVPSLNVKGEEFSLVSATPDHPIYKRMPICCLAGKGTGPLPFRVVPGSLKIFRIEDGKAGAQYEDGVDFIADAKWTSIERMPTGAAAEGEKVLLNYSVYRKRVDAIVLTQTGQIELVSGNPTQLGPSPPKPPAGTILLANVLCESLDQKLTATNVMKVYKEEVFRNPEFDDLNDEALARVKKKLATNSPLKIAFCGDSVTKGCYSSCDETSFPRVFIKKLKEKYPKCPITDVIYGIPGAPSTTVFPHFYTEVMPQKPDLIIIEIVNDVTMERATVLKNYNGMFSRAKAIGAEVLVCLPHLPAPSYYGVRGWSAITCKPYFSIVEKMARDNNVGLANVARRWENAENEGIDPMLLLADHLNHPNDRGHEIYAEELMRCFDDPPKL